MASLQNDPSGNFHVCFRFGGTRFKRSLGTKNKREAESLAGRIEVNIRLVERGIRDIPEGADVPQFLLSDGKRTEKPRVKKTLRLSDLFDEFFGSLPDGNLEESTLYGMHIHHRHFERLLGKFHFREFRAL